MSENILPTSDDRVPDQESMAQISGGAMLRKAREAAGLHIAALAVSLKVSVKKLEALETDQLDLLPDIVFVRALAASVCRTLKIDPDPILERLPHTTVPRLKTDESGINAPFRASGDVSGLLFWNQLSRPFVLAVLVLLVGVVVLVFFPFTQRTDVASAPKSGIAAVISPLTTATQSSSLALSSSDAPLVLNPGSVEFSASLPVLAASAPPAMVPGSGASTGLLVLKARGSSWVEVVDARGVVQVRKIMTDGEVVGVSGAMPLSVVVGRADAVEVQVRDKSFDLTRIAKDNVARFEVK